MLPVRFEIKYVVSRADAQRLLDRAGAWMRPDPHAGAGFEYEVRSLYYDTPAFRHYDDVVQGLPDRRKFRARGYGDGRDLFFEVKSRVMRSVIKTRQKAGRDAVEAFLRDPFGSPLPGPCAEHAAELAAEPHAAAAAVRYDRIALESLLEDGIRLTLDRNIRCGGPAAFDRPASLEDARLLPPGRAVLELKFPGRLPSWLSRAVRELELVPREYSKYAQAVRRLYGCAAPAQGELSPWMSC